MRLYEFEGSGLFRSAGIPVPEFAVAADPKEARQQATEMGLPVVIKAQVLTGGRGLAGGVQVAESLDQVAAATQRILGSSIRGLPVLRVMVARKVEITQEFYLGVTVDGYEGTPVAILSAAGGVSIEEISQAHPELVVSRRVPITNGLSRSEAQQMAREVRLDGEELETVSGVLHTLYSVFREYDALIAEINPLVRTLQGTYLALDAKVEIDDSSLFRHTDLQLSYDERTPSLLERKGREIGVTYVELDGDIGIIASGAGLGMTTMDVVGQRFRPANFMETGGAITADLLYQVMGLVLEKEGVKAVFINLYGGINPIHEGAKGVVRYLEEHPTTIPIVARALGNRQEETWEILKAGGVKVVAPGSTEAGVAELFQLLEGNS